MTMIDSGVDLSHEEFAGRPNTIALNTQTFDANQDEEHGTATASVVGAPVNGKGIVGIYPQAKLQLWDASPAGQLTVGDEIAGLAAARRHGPGVINLSLGGFDRLPIEEHAILNAFGAGQLVVASAGNSGEEGSPLVVPRELRARAHGRRHGRVRPRDRLLQRLAGDGPRRAGAGHRDRDPDPLRPERLRLGRRHELLGPARLRRRRRGLDAAADADEHAALRGHAPLGARRRQGRLGPDTGYGILDVPAALTRKPPPVDPQEPNEDVYLVRPNGLTRAGKTPLTAQHRPRATIIAQLERREDPEDVYRVYLPAKGKVVVTVRPNANVDLELWGKRTTTVFERGAAAQARPASASRPTRARGSSA